MKTINDAKRIISEQGVDAYRAHIKTIRSDLETLRGLYADSISTNETPAQTVAAYVAAVGFDRAAVVLASLVNRYAWDGRIGETAKVWAEGIENAYDENAGAELYISADAIHRCHLDQLARAMAEYVPAETTNTTTDTTTDAQSADDMKGANTMNTTNNTDTTTDAATVSVLDILEEARQNTEYAHQLCDYSGSTCIDDAFHEIADGNTSIYYYDIINYISAHVEEVNDAIAEIGWDGCGADLYKAGQLAEYLGILRDLEENTADAVTIWAADYIRHLYGETISADAWQAIADALENIDSSDYLDDIAEAVNAVMNPEADEDDDVNV